ncbi:hypothetical protein UM814_05955 [Staphylococcus aureus]|nr:hypothetical protein UM814_05955 [Staphylococcus aureus]
MIKKKYFFIVVPQPALPVEFLLKFSMLGPRQPALPVEFHFLKFSMLGPRQPALPVEFLFEILYVEATPTCIACRISF